MTDAILIVGSGVTGLTAAQVCAEAGARVIVVEQGAVAGGSLAAAMTDNAPASVDGLPVPKLSALEQAENIELITLASLERADGGPGNFDVEIRERARFVTDDCTRCNRCRPVCPAVRPNEYDAGLTYRKAIFTPLPQTLPQEFVIDIDSCLNKPPNYLPCNRCTEVCDDNAIRFDLPLERRRQRKVGAIVVATGLSAGVDRRLGDYGYGAHPDVVTTVELQRLLLAPGPTGGYAARPSNEEYPDSVLLILDELTPSSAYTAVSQIHRLIDQGVGRIGLLITSQPRDGDEVPVLPRSVAVAWGLVQKVETGDTGNGITVSYADFTSSRIPEEHYDMVVLGTDAKPADSLPALASVLGCELDGSGFVAVDDPHRTCATSRPGVYAAGGASGPATLPQALAQAKAAAMSALADLDPRLLQPGVAPAPGDTSPERPGALSENELRARIENALNELLRRAD